MEKKLVSMMSDEKLELEFRALREAGSEHYNEEWGNAIYSERLRRGMCASANI